MWRRREAQWNKRLLARRYVHYHQWPTSSILVCFPVLRFKRQSWPQSNEEWINLAIVYSLKLEENSNFSSTTEECGASARDSGDKWEVEESDSTGTSSTSLEEPVAPTEEASSDALYDLWIPHRVPIETLLVPGSYPFTMPLSDFTALVDKNYATPLSTLFLSFHSLT